MCLKINRSVKTPWHRRSMGVAFCGLWAPYMGNFADTTTPIKSPSFVLTISGLVFWLIFSWCFLYFWYCFIFALSRSRDCKREKTYKRWKKRLSRVLAFRQEESPWRRSRYQNVTGSDSLRYWNDFIDWVYETK